MKKLLSIALVFYLILSLSITAFAVTPNFKIPNISIPDISNNIKVEISDDFWDNWFKEHPLPEIVLKPKAPTISSAKYIHKTLYFGTSKHLEIQWDKIENASSYEVLITKADGTTITREVTNNLIYDKAIECPKVYIKNSHTWTSATVQVRVKVGDQISDWSAPVKISCDRLH